MNRSENPWKLTLLGEATLRNAEGDTVTVGTRKNILLLAMLAMRSGTPCNRAELSHAVWPGADPKTSRDSLRNALSTLRKSLPEDSISSDLESITLAEGVILCDAALSPEGQTYTGDFMPGFETDWVIDLRLSLRSDFAKAAITKAKSLWESGSTDEALAAAEEACRVDPFDQDAAKLRVDYLQAVGQSQKAVAFADSFRSKSLRDLGVVSDLRVENKEVTGTDHPMVTAAEWLLDRNPDEALALLAGTESQWLSMATEKAVSLHWRTLQASRHDGPKRATVAARHAYLLSLTGKLGPYLESTEATYKSVRGTADAPTCFRLGAAISYGYLSKGDFDKSLTYARELVAMSQDSRDPVIIAESILLLSIIEVHVGDVLRGHQRTEEAYSRIQDCGDASSNAGFGIVRAGALIEANRIDEAASLLGAARRFVDSGPYDRVRGWVLHGEAVLAKANGDPVTARSLAHEIKAFGPEVVGHSVFAAADDLLTEIDFRLREFDTAAEASARASAYRKHLGTVASNYERGFIDPVVRVLGERLGAERLQAIYRQARAS